MDMCDLILNFLSSSIGEFVDSWFNASLLYLYTFIVILHIFYACPPVLSFGLQLYCIRNIYIYKFRVNWQLFYDKFCFYFYEYDSLHLTFLSEFLILRVELFIYCYISSLSLSNWKWNKKSRLHCNFVWCYKDALEGYFK